MNNVIRMVPQEQLNELQTLLEWALHARATGRKAAADSLMMRAIELAREIGGER